MSGMEDLVWEDLTWVTDFPDNFSGAMVGFSGCFGNVPPTSPTLAWSEEEETVLGLSLETSLLPFWRK